MRGSLNDRAIDEGEDTLTESCEGAVNFMVIEMMDGSLLELPGLRSGGKGWEMRSRPKVVPRTGGNFCFYQKDPSSVDQLRARAVGGSGSVPSLYQGDVM